MATTITPEVGNSIALADKYLPKLDELYKAGAKSTVLDTAESDFRWDGAKAIKVYKLNADGLGDYERNGGFVRGDVDGTWETLSIEIDRGRSFSVDALDNEESAGLAFGRLLGEFERTKVIPEVDAYRFAKLAALAGKKGTPTTITSSTNIADLIDAAVAELDNAEVPYEGRILFVSPACYKQLKGNITRYTYNGENDVNYNVEMYNDMRIITVPQARFYTAITLNQPTSHSDIGGYTVAGVPINFMIVHPSAVKQVVKHRIPNIFAPAQNQQGDAWLLNYRIYHDCFVLENKADGIFLSASAPATAMSASSTSVSAAGDVTISNALGTLKAESTDEGVATVVAGANKVTITKVANGSAKVIVTDGIGQKVEISVSFS